MLPATAVNHLQEVPALSSSAGSGQHSDPVWQVRWVDRGQEQEERLVTISTDGRVTQWATTKASCADAVCSSLPEAGRCRTGHAFCCLDRVMQLLSAP